MRPPARALAECRRILDRSGSSFSVALRILPPAQRDALTAFYAFCREIDDAVDEATDPASARERIRAWRGRLDGLREGRRDGPVCEALGWAVDRFGIRHEHLDLVLEGVEQDLGSSRFRTFEDLYAYCYRVASAVGLVCVTVTCGPAADAGLYAELTGIAVQMTNILRDVGEDARRGRIYLPLEDLEACGANESDILDGRMTGATKRLLRFEAARARHFYDLAGAALPAAPPGRAFFCETVRATYSRLLERLVERDLPVFRERVALATPERVAIALRHALRVPSPSEVRPWLAR